MSEKQQKRLSFFEAVNFYSLNIHGEKSLIEGLAHRLYEDRDPAHSQYIHHFLDEENKHMTFFGNFCTRYAGKVYQDRKISFPRDYAPGEEEFLFFVKIFIFEEIVDHYNLRMSKDERLESTARKINHYHHVDESRHLAYGKTYLKEVFEKYSPGWGAEQLQNIRDYIHGYMVSTWREYYNPDVYKDAGLSDPYELAERVFESESARQHRNKVTASCIQYLVKTEILPQGFKL